MGAAGRAGRYVCRGRFVRALSRGRYITQFPSIEVGAFCVVAANCSEALWIAQQVLNEQVSRSVAVESERVSERSAA
jgi:hypothetical protein